MSRLSLLVRVSFPCVVVTVVAMYAAAPAHARIRKIQITMKQSPAFSGYSWPGVGQYEKIVGKAFGELGPRDPKNSVIVDLRRLFPGRATQRTTATIENDDRASQHIQRFGLSTMLDV